MRGLVQAFCADVREGWSLFIGEWFTLKCFMGDGVIFRGDGIPLNSSTDGTCIRAKLHFAFQCSSNLSTRVKVKV